MKKPSIRDRLDSWCVIGTNMAGIREYSESDRTAATLSLVAFVAGISLIWTAIGPGHSAASLSEASGSQVIPSTILAIFRTIAAMASVFTLSAIASNKEGLNYNVLDYETKIYGPRRLLGTSRLAAYTMWSFGLLGIYFSIAAFVTCLLYTSPSPRDS